MDEPNKIAERIKMMCETRNVSINKMLLDSGAGARLYHNILRGSYPSVDKFAKIADYFECSIDYLVGRSDNLN